MRVYKLESKNEEASNRPHQGLAYEAVNAGPQPDDPVQRMESNDASMGQADGDVVQMVRAFRVGTTKSNYKINIDPKTGKIIEFKGGRSGIDISFESRAHAEYYLQTKIGDSQAKLVEWEMNDDLYAMIKRRMGIEVKGDIPASWIAPKKGKPGRLAALWTKIQKLSKPVNSTDVYVTKNKLVAPHFGLDWIPIFNVAGKGRASVTGHDEEDSSDTESAVPAAQFAQDDMVAVMVDDSGDWIASSYAEALTFITDMEAKEHEIISKAEAIRRNLLTEENFEEEEQ